MNKKGKLIILIGLPASGKSNWTEQYEKENDCVVVSSDAIREEVFGDINVQSHNGEVFNIVNQRCREGLSKGKTVILDATNLSRKKRISFLKSMPPCEKEAVVFNVPFEICYQRNIDRERTVPKETMWRMYKSFQPPHYAEGFDEISFESNCVLFDSVSYRKELLVNNLHCEHDNPHHTYSCGEHCHKAWTYIYSKYRNLSKNKYNILSVATEAHDMSKFKCKVFTNAKGEPSDIVHYYGHEYVSAYDFLACYEEDFKIEELVLISNLIANHMVYYAGEAAVKKRKKLYGKDFFWYLDKIHEADINAH